MKCEVLAIEVWKNQIYVLVFNLFKKEFLFKDYSMSEQITLFTFDQS